MSLARDEFAEQIHEMSEAEEWAMFDRAARHYLGVSGKDFLHRWRAGEYSDPDSDRKVMRVALLIPASH